MTENITKKVEESTIKECGCDKTVPETTDPHKTGDTQKTETSPNIAQLEAKFDQVTKNYNEQQLKITALEAELKGNTATPKPTATVPDQVTMSIGTKEFADKAIKAIETYGKFEFPIPYETLRNLGVSKVNTPNGIRESFSRNYADNGMNIAETASGVTISTSAGIANVDPTVAFVPGGISFAPVRQYCKFKSLAKGQTSAKFLKTTLPTTASQTAGTTATAATQTITSVSATPSTITGVYQLVNTDIEENEPEDILATVLQSAMMTILNFEAVDVLTTISKEGTLTPGVWYKGDGSSTTAITTSDNASIKFDPKGIALGRQYLENQGYLRDGVRPVVFIHPQQLREAYTSSNYTTFMQYARPEITQAGQLGSIHGVDIVVTNAIEAKTNTTNNAYNAIMCVPQHSYGVAVQREAKIILHQYGEDNQIRANVSWRFKSVDIDDTSIVRLSTTQ